MHRREFSNLMLQSIAVALFAQKVSADGLLEKKASERVRKWIAAHDDIATQLVSGRITGLQWQSEVERLARDVDRRELLEQVDFDAIEKSMDLTNPGGTKKIVRLSDQRVQFGAAIFGLRQRNAITPHAHKHMVSAHMVIKGELHARNFDRVAEEPGHLIIEPSVDTTIRPGDVSTMSSQRNNVHWFTALTPAAFTLDVIIDSLTPNEKPYVIELLDPNGAQRLPNGQRRARLIDWKESVRLYGTEA